MGAEGYHLQGTNKYDFFENNCSWAADIKIQSALDLF